MRISDWSSDVCSSDLYFDMIDERLPGHGHNVAEMRKRKILIDGSPETGEGLLLQIFTENMIGPIFFEIIQRKGNQGFGRSEEHTSELQSLMRISYAVFCLKTKKTKQQQHQTIIH